MLARKFQIPPRIEFSSLLRLRAWPAGSESERRVIAHFVSGAGDGLKRKVRVTVGVRWGLRHHPVLDQRTSPCFSAPNDPDK